MNGFSPDRRPQQLAQMLAAQERNSSLNGPGMQQPMRPSSAYAGATPNSAPGVAPQSMNFNGPPGPQQYGGPISNPSMSAMAAPQQAGVAGGMPMGGMGRPMGSRMSPQVGGQMQRPRGPGAQGYPRSPGLTTPQGGGYRGDFDYGTE
jgi:hypothetical protein